MHTYMLYTRCEYLLISHHLQYFTKANFKILYEYIPIQDFKQHFQNTYVSALEWKMNSYCG